MEEEEKKIVKIANILRQLGRNVGVDETIDAINSLKLIGDRDTETVNAILKATMIKDFSLNVDEQRDRKQSEEDKYSVLGRVTNRSYLANDFYIYSPAESRIKSSALSIGNSDLIKWNIIAKRINEIALSLEGHRFKVKRNGKVDMRRTMKSEIKYSLESPYLVKSEKKMSKSNFILLCDVSGSMKDFFKEILLFSFFMKRISNKTEIFYFSTNLRRVTSLFQVTSINRIKIDKLISIISYGSGTRIGEALYSLRRSYGDLIHRKCSLIIFSDGWDLGNLELLGRELKNIKNRCKSIIWVNPLMDNPSYTPATEGIKIALKYVDLMTSPNIIFNDKKIKRK
ncbi:VWA domain-containing protein [Sulfolobus tengchongensis]|uniref:VWA domain-containing protein n=1 Tax=Sulfolobus tengchongensis TaxID=207809 RepID=A0AAX4L476_9CREN